MARRSRDGDQTSESDPDVPYPSDAPSTPTTIGEQLEWAARVLETVGALEPAREAAALLASVMGLPNIPAEADPGAWLPASLVDRFLAVIARRMRDETPRR